MQKTQDVEHRYDNYLTTSFTEQGRCRVRVYEDVEGVEPRVVVITQIDAGGVSITTAIEYVCAEIASKFLWPHPGEDTVWIEHYPSCRSRRESLQRVRFADPYPIPGVREAGRRKQIAYGVPSWERTCLSDVERMVGESL